MEMQRWSATPPKTVVPTLSKTGEGWGSLVGGRSGKIKIVGQECPTHTVTTQGGINSRSLDSAIEFPREFDHCARDDRWVEGNAALKRCSPMTVPSTHINTHPKKLLARRGRRV
jgi:hypothetical protein